MKDIATLFEIDKGRAEAWFTRSLTEGADLASAVLKSDLFDSGHFFVIAPQSFNDREPDLGAAGVIGRSYAGAGLARLIENLTEAEASCIVVESELARKSDSQLDHHRLPSAYIGDRVVNWFDLGSPGSGPAAVRAIDEASAGYPLNAFITSASASDLGLVDQEPAPVDVPHSVVASLLAIVVSAFDGESFAIWRADGRSMTS